VKIRALAIPIRLLAAGFFPEKTGYPEIAPSEECVEP